MFRARKIPPTAPHEASHNWPSTHSGEVVHQSDLFFWPTCAFQPDTKADLEERPGLPFIADVLQSYGTLLTVTPLLLGYSELLLSVNVPGPDSVRSLTRRLPYHFILTIWRSLRYFGSGPPRALTLQSSSKHSVVVNTCHELTLSHGSSTTQALFVLADDSEILTWTQTQNTLQYCHEYPNYLNYLLQMPMNGLFTAARNSG